MDGGVGFLKAAFCAGNAPGAFGLAEGVKVAAPSVPACVADTGADSALELGSGAVCEQAPTEMPKITAHA